MTTTPNLGLSYLVASQAQKEMTHNDALNDLDVLAQPIVISRSLSAPPISPADGDAYIVAASPSGAWTGFAGALAIYFSGWKLKTPKEGWRFFVKAEGVDVLYRSGAWVPLTLAASTTWAPGTISNGAGLSSSSISVSGAALGDYVLVAAPYSLQGVLATAYVSTANAVTVRLYNATGGSVTLSSGTWNIKVVKA